MTTYRYTLLMNDSEMVALDAALDFYLAHCNQQVSSGAGSPFWAHREAIQKILSRGFDDIKQVSGRVSR